MSGERPELRSDMRFHARAWRFERIGWIVLFAVVLAAIAGALGPGLFAREARVSASDGSLHVRWERSVYVTAVHTIEVSITTRSSNDGFALWVARGFLRHHRLHGVVPEPERVEIAGDGYLYRFAAAPSSERASVRFALEGRVPGRARGDFAIPGGAGVHVEQVVYP